MACALVASSGEATAQDLRACPVPLEAHAYHQRVHRALRLEEPDVIALSVMVVIPSFEPEYSVGLFVLPSGQFVIRVVKAKENIYFAGRYKSGEEGISGEHPDESVSVEVEQNEAPIEEDAGMQVSEAFRRVLKGVGFEDGGIGLDTTLYRFYGTLYDHGLACGQVELRRHRHPQHVL